MIFSRLPSRAFGPCQRTFFSSLQRHSHQKDIFHSVSGSIHKIRIPETVCNSECRVGVESRVVQRDWQTRPTCSALSVTMRLSPIPTLSLLAPSVTHNRVFPLLNAVLSILVSRSTIASVAFHLSPSTDHRQWAPPPRRHFWRSGILAVLVPSPASLLINRGSRSARSPTAPSSISAGASSTSIL